LTLSLNHITTRSIKKLFFDFIFDKGLLPNILNQ
jgi:hypothetical protein